MRRVCHSSFSAFFAHLYLWSPTLPRVFPNLICKVSTRTFLLDRHTLQETFISTAFAANPIASLYGQRSFDHALGDTNSVLGKTKMKASFINVMKDG